LHHLSALRKGNSTKPGNDMLMPFALLCTMPVSWKRKEKQCSCEPALHNVIIRKALQHPGNKNEMLLRSEFIIPHYVNAG